MRQGVEKPRPAPVLSGAEDLANDITRAFPIALSLPLSKSLQNIELPSFSASNAATVNGAFRPRHNPTSFVV
jgi:hypothetical protein